VRQQVPVAFLLKPQQRFVSLGLVTKQRPSADPRWSNTSSPHPAHTHTHTHTDQIVNEVGEGPDRGDAGEGHAEQDDMQEADAQDVGQPHAPAVHHPGVGVHLAVRRAHVHGGGGGGGAADRSQSLKS